MTAYGTKVGVTLKKGDAESFVVAVTMKVGYQRAGVYGSLYPSFGSAALTDSASVTEVFFRRSSHKQNFCMQLSCIPSAASLTEGGISSYSTTTVCPAASDWTTSSYYRNYVQSSYSYTYYYFSVYGWVPSSQTNNEFVATFTRPTAQAACSCAAIGITTYENHQVLFPTATRFLNETITQTSVDSTKYVTKNLQISTLSPLATSASDSDRKAYCTCWAKKDSESAVIQQRAKVVGNCFKCPAKISPNEVLPRGFWPMRGWGSSWWNRYFGEVGTTDQTCFRAFGTWQSGRTPWMRRCCYNRVGVNLEYIPKYPSKVALSTGWGSWPDYYTERVFAYASDTNPEQVCCRYGGGMDSQGAACRLYRDRRSVEVATTSTFTNPRGCDATWTPAPPRGFGRGDPYCTTMDGAGFECNFWGEVLWTSCGTWKVHTAAEPVSTGALATVITAVAVSEGNETVVIQRNVETGDSTVRVNGEEQLDDYDGSFLSVSFDQTSSNLTIARVSSIAGNHQAEVETLANSLTLSVAPDASCIGNCSGLMGNCDGDASNDIKSRDGTVSLSADTAGDVIFSNVVVSYLINETAQSLFDFNVSAPATGASFSPSFVTPEILDSCPSACNSDPGCCLDSVVGGPSFVNDSVATLILVAEAKTQTAPLTGYNWPPTISLNPRVAVLNGLPITQEITATDTNGLQSFTIDACDAVSGVTCTQDTAVDSSTTVKYVLSTTASRNFTVIATANDTEGAVTVAFMVISSLPPPPPPANAASYTLTIPGSGFNAGHVFEARLYLFKDLARIVNAYWEAAGTSGDAAPAFTAAADFAISAVTDVVSGVEVAVYITGDTVAEANARLAALDAQTSLDLTETNNALSQLVSSADTTETTTAAPTDVVPSPTSVVVATTSAATTSTVEEDGDSGSARATSVWLAAALVAVCVALSA
jgi:hypothetical protein